MSFRVDLPRKFLVNAFKNQTQRELRDKYKKKGVLTKIVHANQKKSLALVDILRESDSFNAISSYDRMTSSSSSSPSSASASSTANNDVAQESNNNQQFLKKFRSTVVGGPKFSIAQTRAHHLSNFLSEYMLNAFSEGLFDVIEIDDPKQEQSEQQPGEQKKKRPAQRFVFEISNVELLADMSAIQVYWLCSSDERINLSVEATLNAKLRNQIRARLIEDRVINYVPRVVFCRDPSRVIAEKLDEYLVKIDLEKKTQAAEAAATAANDQEDEDTDESTKKEESKPSITTMSMTPTATTTTTTKSVNNLYGVDVNKLIDLIRKDGQNTEWKPSSSTNLPQTVNHNAGDLTTTADGEGVDAAAKFAARLKAFEINKRQKVEKMNKSALARLARIEFESSGRDEAANS